MAITLITGLPGNAKTLHAISEVVEQAARENRPVYHAGLKGLNIDHPRLKGTQWIELDPLRWHETVPSGSLIFIDEAQKVFRSRSLGSIPPKHVTELEEHRHKGLDFVMVTQHPSLIDPSVRKLTQTHKHLVRIWGMEATTVHRWDAVRDNCDKPTARKDSESLKWVFDKSLYGVYHSADVHTMKRRIPGRVKMLVVLPLLVFGLGYYTYIKLKHPAVQPTPSPIMAASPGQTGALAAAASSGTPAAASSQLPLAITDPVADAKSYLGMREPRIQGLPETAPRYDQLTAAVRVPVPAMCVQIGDPHQKEIPVRCKCYSQQGTVLDTEFNMCVQLAQGGRFLDFNPDPDRPRDQPPGPSSHPSSSASGSVVVAAR
jgi:zona occludens toxin